MAERAFETPLEHVASFIETASKQERTALVEGLWSALEKDPDRLQASAAAIYCTGLRAFLLRAPETTGRLAVAGLDVKDWGVGSSKRTQGWGMPRLANQFAALGREDLAAALREDVLLRADPADFSAPYGAILDVGVLLSGLSAALPKHVEVFVDTICTRDWLDGQYAQTYFRMLSSGLVLLGLSQPPSVLRRFWSPKFRARIEEALALLADAENDALCEAVRFLGAAQLIGRRMPRQPFRDARVELIASLPTKILPHRPGTDCIEPDQQSLWLGLRVVATLASARLAVGHSVIAETLQRWRVTLAESAKQPGSARHRLDESQVTWLEACDSHGSGVLLESREPLWLIPGFDWDPTAR